jgi:hypothetical protein
LKADPMNKADAVREVLTELGQDAPAADIAATVRERYGVNVSPAYVRVCRSRDARDSPRPARIKPAPVSVSHDRMALPAPRPRASAQRPTPQANLEPDQDEKQVFQLIDKCVQAIELALGGKTQQVTGPPDLIAEIAAVLDDEDVRGDYPGYAYDVLSDGQFKTLRLYNAELPPIDSVPDHNAVHVPSDPRDFTIAARPRRASKNRERECDFCEGNRQHVLGTNLYQVRGGPIGPKMLILCGMHAQAMATAGSDVRPYRVMIPAEYGVVRPEPIPYKEMLVNATRTFLGLDV